MADLPNTGYNKAIGAGAGGGVGGAIATLIISLFWPHADAATAASLTTVCCAVVSIVGAYLPQHKNGGG